MVEPQIFISHTRKDIEFCDVIDRAMARVGLRAFRSEFEKIDSPAWMTIKGEIQNSNALILAIGKELVAYQNSYNKDWRFTQNWIAYEIGIACQLNIDVWVICDNVDINFPVPYLNNYLPLSLHDPEIFHYFVDSLKYYKGFGRIPFPLTNGKDNYYYECPNPDCKSIFNMHLKIKPGGIIICPTCLNPIGFPEGFPFPPISENI